MTPLLLVAFACKVEREIDDTALVWDGGSGTTDQWDWGTDGDDDDTIGRPDDTDTDPQDTDTRPDDTDTRPDEPDDPDTRPDDGGDSGGSSGGSTGGDSGGSSGGSTGGDSGGSSGGDSGGSTGGDSGGSSGGDSGSSGGDSGGSTGSDSGGSSGGDSGGSSGGSTGSGSCTADWYEEDDSSFGSVYLGDVSDYSDTKHWVYADTYLTFTGDEDFYYFYADDGADDWFTLDFLVRPPSSLDVVLDIYYWNDSTGSWDWLDYEDSGYAGDAEYFQFEGGWGDDSGYYGALVSEYANAYDCSNTYSFDAVNDYWGSSLSDAYLKY